MILTLESTDAVTVKVSRGAWHHQQHLRAGDRVGFVVLASHRLEALTFEVSAARSRRPLWATVAINY
jgi:hypothetical protein